MFRVARIEGIALLLLVSSTGHAGSPAYLSVPARVSPGAGELGGIPRAAELRARAQVATPAAVEIALFELVDRVERTVEAAVTSDPAAVLLDWVAPLADGTDVTSDALDGDSHAAPAARLHGPPRRQTVETEAFAATQHGPFDHLVHAAALHWRINPFLLKGLLANESNLEPVRFGKRRFGKHNGQRLVVAGGAIGIAQFSGGGIRAVKALRAKRHRRGERVLGFDIDRALVPQEAIYAAAELLAHLLGRYGRDGGITAYNSGVIGGLAVHRLGFWRARRAGKLRRSGPYHVQGERFLLNVLRRTNRYRRAAGLAPLAPPAKPEDRRPITRVAVL